MGLQLYAYLQTMIIYAFHTSTSGSVDAKNECCRCKNCRFKSIKTIFATNTKDKESLRNSCNIDQWSIQKLVKLVLSKIDSEFFLFPYLFLFSQPLRMGTWLTRFGHQPSRSSCHPWRFHHQCLAVNHPCLAVNHLGFDVQSSRSWCPIIKVLTSNHQGLDL